ncbi:hypothetical protein SAMN04515648_1347 [Phyllobacterium sp. CL33Tsu]|uniref:hypothetical protein n=1 Tax=Phyllobacterium TaxID=28100 RepID=UPI0008E41C65|nr:MULTISPECIES: hypothetical protein [unclassified Phyllobacterium]UGY10176.1 hypothetical protein LLE51_003050 [Phyllobacterium sp. T1018]SFI72141.1 hypothetical protein SAMN04515648_1347 [Phyllobacterium sp. CL33Tsu]
MEGRIPDPEVFTHVRVIIGIILGLSVSRLLTGVARIIQHPQRKNIFAVHLGWVLFTFLTVVHFWWFEFYLHELVQWTFEAYLFVIFFASIHFLACALLFPDSMEGYSGYEDYFMSRRAWYFGILIAIFVVDFFDTAMKGKAHFGSLGPEYPFRNLFLIAIAGLGIYLRRPNAQIVLVCLALIVQIAFILVQFDTI